MRGPEISMKPKLVVFSSTASVLFATTALADTYGRGPFLLEPIEGRPLWNVEWHGWIT